MQVKILLLVLSFLLLRVPASAQACCPCNRQEQQAWGKQVAAAARGANRAEAQLARTTARYFRKAAKLEKRLKRKVMGRDSLRAEELFGDVDARYRQVKETPASSSKYSQEYSGHLDSLATALAYLSTCDTVASGDTAALTQAQAALTKLQARLNHNGKASQYLTERQAYLTESLNGMATADELAPFQKQAYYYREQTAAYRQAFEDPGKLEAMLLKRLEQAPAFQEFFQTRSQLASLFSLLGSGPASMTPQGLQSHTTVRQAIAERFGDPSKAFAELQQQSQQQFQGVKDKLKGHATGNVSNANSSEELPFKPNTQKTKSFLQRLEYGFNFQSQGARHTLPVTSDVGISVGYKLHDRSSIGIGSSYRVGWGSSFDDIRITHQGLGFRSFADYQIKGGYYVTGGYELNYLPAFKDATPSVGEARRQAWQPSGVVGVSKKYALHKKIKGNIQLLWDFMSYSQVPRSQAFILRLGYSLN